MNQMSRRGVLTSAVGTSALVISLSTTPMVLVAEGQVQMSNRQLPAAGR
jgi:hypothetical protein